MVVPTPDWPMLKVRELQASLMSTYTKSNVVLDFRSNHVKSQFLNNGKFPVFTLFFVVNWCEIWKIWTTDRRGQRRLLYAMHPTIVNSSADLLCSPVLVPQMTGGTLPLGPVTEKVSVKHWVASLKAAVPVKRMLPFNDFETVVTTVVGPAITKELKSKRSWNKKKYIKKPTFLLIALFGPGQSAKNL